MADFMTTEDVAAMLRTSPATVRYWHHKGYGPKSFKVGRRRLYERSDVQAFVDVLREGPNPRTLD